MTVHATDAATLAQRAFAVAADTDTAADADVPSPCVSICRMDAEGVLCAGCLRTIPEIAGWSRSDAAGKRKVWRAIGARAAAHAGALPSTGDVTP